MSTRVYLDASFIVAYLVSEHPFNTRAVKLLTERAEAVFVVSWFCINEVMYVLSRYNLPKKKIADTLVSFLRDVPELEIVGGSSELLVLRAYLKFWATHSLRPTDAAHLFLMKQASAGELASFDRDFVSFQDELGFEVIP